MSFLNFQLQEIHGIVLWYNFLRREDVMEYEAKLYNLTLDKENIKNIFMKH